MGAAQGVFFPSPAGSETRREGCYGRGPAHRPCSASFARARSCWVSSRLRNRMVLGVTSTSSSLLMKSSDCSRLSFTAGVSRTAMSAVEERTLVCFFSLHTFTTRSAGR